MSPHSTPLYKVLLRIRKLYPLAGHLAPPTGAGVVLVLFLKPPIWIAAIPGFAFLLIICVYAAGLLLEMLTYKESLANSTTTKRRHPLIRNIRYNDVNTANAAPWKKTCLRVYFAMRNAALIAFCVYILQLSVYLLWRAVS